MPKTLFACTYYEKYADGDRFVEGCMPGTRRCVFARYVTVTGNSMPDLIKNISRELCLDCEFVSWKAWPDDSGSTSNISFNRHENDDGDKATADQIIQWKAGELDLWLAVYAFHIEKRIVSPVSSEDPQGVKFHG